MKLCLKSAVCAVAFMTCGAQAQETAGVTAQDIVIGQQYVFQSPYLEKEQALQIALPASYEQEAERSYPVLYVLDGQWQFQHAVSFVNRLSSKGFIPELIIVGVPHSDQENSRYYAGSETSENVLAFLKETAVPYVESNYRTRGGNTLAGWAYTGGFAIHALLKAPDTFEAAITSSPFPVANYESYTGKTSAQLLAELEAFEQKKFLSFGADTTESPVIEGTQALAGILEESAPSNLEWHFTETTGEEHITTPHVLLYSGLRKRFADYGDPIFKTMEEFKVFGGLEGVKRFYRVRGDKYGVSKDVSEDGIFWMARIAMQNDDVALMDRLRANFDRYFARQRAYWINAYAQFYLKHGKARAAVKMYERLVARFPSSVGAYAGLGEAYAAAERTGQAKKMYERAVDLAKDKKDERLNELQEKLAALK